MLRTLPLLAVLVCLCPGCEMERRVVSSSWDNWKKLEWYDASASGGGSDESGPTRGRGYAIELGRFTGDDAFQRVYRLITTARQEAGLANLWYVSSGRQAVVYAGRFRAEDDPEAEAMLRVVRNAEINGDTPFEDANVVAVANNRGEVLDERDARRLAGRNIYMLQVGYYDRAFGLDFRKAAETAVDVLREQGEEAYYYHGPHRSMVLVGSWTYREAFTSQPGQQDRYSNAVRVMQEKYTHNVPNGRPFTDADDPAVVASQRSFLVPIR
ncbi:MAG: hypothetical protein ACE37H_07560 [Phycisphaeraceae bacterium]